MEGLNAELYSAKKDKIEKLKKALQKQLEKRMAYKQDGYPNEIQNKEEIQDNDDIEKESPTSYIKQNNDDEEKESDEKDTEKKGHK